MIKPKTFIIGGVEMRAVGQSDAERDILHNVAAAIDRAANKAVDELDTDGTVAMGAMCSVMAYWVAVNYPDPAHRDTALESTFEMLREAADNWAETIRRKGP
jgi:hypothetical protein